jgi:hypothetical protein
MPAADPVDKPKSYQELLADYVVGECKSSFDEMMSVVRAVGWGKDCPGFDDWSTFGEIAEKLAKSLYNAKRGLRSEIEKARG